MDALFYEQARDRSTSEVELEFLWVCINKKACPPPPLPTQRFEIACRMYVWGYSSRQEEKQNVFGCLLLMILRTCTAKCDSGPMKRRTNTMICFSFTYHTCTAKWGKIGQRPHIPRECRRWLLFEEHERLMLRLEGIDAWSMVFRQSHK